MEWLWIDFYSLFISADLRYDLQHAVVLRHQEIPGHHVDEHTHNLNRTLNLRLSVLASGLVSVSK